VLATVPRGNPDGLAVDETGCVWVALGGGGAIARFTPTGALDAVLEVPSPFVASLCFGGADRHDLYVATMGNTDDPSRGGTLFRTRVDIPGLVASPARV
jgi:sugar lactone lactonase YvrE